MGFNGEVTVIGAGLAGSECAWQAARAGVPVTLYEMRPLESTPAHSTDLFAELVCSNSLRGGGLENAVGLLKEELRRLGSVVMQAADHHRVPAGGALAVDREAFSSEVTNRVSGHPGIRVVRRRVDELPAERPVVVATGPLTAENLAAQLGRLTGTEYLHFFDAAAPIVTCESLNMDKLFWASRYGKGDQYDYLNAPMTAAEYTAFREALCSADEHESHEFEGPRRLFEGCLPVEELARRGEDTLRYGPLKPVGLTNPATGHRPYAVVQLRREDAAGTMFNLVGFQTRLRFGEQRRIFSMIPGLEKAEFNRYGRMHRNTFLNSPKLLFPTFQARWDAGLLFAGQITGSEGYVESIAGGFLAGVNAARMVLRQDPLVFPEETAIGALARYVATSPAKNFQPMNICFGLIPPLEERIRDKRERYRRTAMRSLEALRAFASSSGLPYEVSGTAEPPDSGAHAETFAGDVTCDVSTKRSRGEDE